MIRVSGKRLLADVLRWKEEKIEEAILLKDNYSLIEQRKKDGSLRMIHSPHPQLKRFQKRFLKYFLYRIPLDNYTIIKGFRPGFSYIDNAKWHSRKNTKFVLRLDFEDAFPSVKVEHLRQILKQILFAEIERYTRKEQSSFPLFSVKRAKWFRKLFKDLPQLNLFYDYPLKTINEFIELVLSLVTYKGKIPQGAPSSPYLLDIILYYSGLMNKVYQFLWDKEVLVSDSGGSMDVFSIYADDFTISSSSQIARTLINDLINLIEQELIFKVNRKKIFYFRRDRGAPLVTGLRLVKLTKSGEELETILQADGLNQRERKNIKRKILNEKGEWIVDSVSFPKKEIKKIRGLINRARYPLFQEALRKKVDGYIACLRAIYGDKLPNQVAIPYQKYQNSLQK